MTWLRRHWSVVVLALAIGIGVGRIALTYPTFYQTWDEPSHVAAGMEWLQYGRFRFEPMHPPLARVALAVGPYLAGLRLRGTSRADSLEFFGGRRALFEQGNALLDSGGTYQRNLTLARLGNLPFFILACLVVWGWTRELFGQGAAAAAVVLFSSVPAVLAHAAIATTGMSVVATLAAALWAWTRWLGRPSWSRTVIAGVATGATLVSKMSGVVFLPVCVAGIIVLRWRLGRASESRSMPWRGWAARIVTAACAGMLVIWATYRFSVGSLADVDPRITDRIEAHVGGRLVHRALVAGATLRVIPAPELLKGVKDLLYYNSEGRKSYLLGKVNAHGSILFFPVGTFFKTPLAFLICIGLGAVTLIRRFPTDRRWEPLVPVLAPVLMLAVVLPAHINIGTRHLLPAFPALGVVAGFGLTRLWRARLPYRGGPTLAAALLAWQLGAGVRAHPDYLPYFNELAALAPQPILLDSDLDWGQDLKRLADTLRTMPVDSLYVAYHGSADLTRRGLPPNRPLPPWTPVHGWVAISIYKLKMGLGTSPQSDHYAWLEAYRPAALVGHSILLYHIP